MHEETTLFEVGASSENHENANSEKPRGGRQVSIWLDNKQIEKIQKIVEHEDSDFSTVAAAIIEAALEEIEAENKSLFKSI